MTGLQTLAQFLSKNQPRLKKSCSYYKETICGSFQICLGWSLVPSLQPSSSSSLSVSGRSVKRRTGKSLTTMCPGPRTRIGPLPAFARSKSLCTLMPSPFRNPWSHARRRRLPGQRRSFSFEPFPRRRSPQFEERCGQRTNWNWGGDIHIRSGGRHVQLSRIENALLAGRRFGEVRVRIPDRVVEQVRVGDVRFLIRSLWEVACDFLLPGLLQFV